MPHLAMFGKCFSYYSLFRAVTLWIDFCCGKNRHTAGFVCNIRARLPPFVIGKNRESP